jgi:hypothetical protein
MSVTARGTATGVNSGAQSASTRSAVRSRWCARPASAARSSRAVTASRIWACSMSPAVCQLTGSES